MVGLKPSLHGAINDLDHAMSRLLKEPVNAAAVVSTLTEWAARHGERAAVDMTVARAFDGTLDKLSRMEHQWSALVTDWLLSDKQEHAAGLAGVLGSISHRASPSFALDRQRLDTLEPAEFLFLARRMLGYVHDREQITAMALSMLESRDAKARIYPVLRALLVDEIGYDYLGSTVGACKAAAGARAGTDAGEFLTGVAAALEEMGNAIDKLPRLNELRPSLALRRQFALARARQMSDSVNEAQKDSIWRQIATEIPIKAGSGAFSYQSASYGDPMKMSSFSHSIEMPRREVFDPVGNAIRLFQYRLARKVEE